MTGWLTALGPAGAAIALLALGHVLGDFVLQTDWLAARKHRPGPLLLHGGIVLVAHAVAFVPLLTRATALLVGVVGAGHLLIDAVTARLRHRLGASARLFLGDQLAHLAVVLGAWALLAPPTWSASPVLAGLAGVDGLPWADLTAGSVYLAAFVFAHEGGNAVVRGVLPEDGPEPAAEEDLEAGSLIGTLERWIVLLLGLAGRWEAVALVVAAKSVARFEELKKRPFAEYFLVGTLTSILVAMGLAVLVSALL